VFGEALVEKLRIDSQGVIFGEVDQIENAVDAFGEAAG